ncbi:MAG: hypothetical protein QRY16_14495 [Enterobacterales bacterium endosymbiont of Blomia tropicalis]|uniref:hypothetical protein n=1 Tax=Mixta mediterraneensis TaxID=2758443 RepID=UPI0025A8E52C|nr:hypothetical protein [Mixta mediterraneensis]MDL4914949.1 hypothetical protein [Mixta mediterraneensis]
MIKDNIKEYFSDQLEALADGGEIIIEQEGICTRVVKMADYTVSLTRLDIYPSRLASLLYALQDSIQDDEHFILNANEIMYVLYLEEVCLDNLTTRIKSIYKYCAAH